VYEKDSIRKTLKVIVEETGRSLPVVDDNNRLIGIVSISDIVPRYLDTQRKELLKETRTSVENIMDVLELKIIYGKIESQFITGDVYLYADISDLNNLRPEDIIICNMKDVYENNLTALNVGAIIIGSVLDDKEIKLEGFINSTVMITHKSVYDVIVHINQAIPISALVQKNNLEYFTTYETIDDVKENMFTSKHTRFPVVTENGLIKGSISRGSLINVQNKRAILVDHNERGQSIEGIDDVTIVEVIDHHRVADIHTLAPLYFRVEPVGCTCTIIAKMYEEKDIDIPQKIAGIMLSAILSDTLLFKSPTCTEEDIKIAKKLAKLSGENIEKYGMKMITHGATLADASPKEMIASDMKKFMFGEYKVMISQINTADFTGFYEIHNDIKKAMEEKCLEDGYALAIFLVTDIIIGGTELLAVGEARWIAENAFAFDKRDESVFLKDVFSRKKQVVPKLMQAAKL
jgi:manganese-dependent inorganic pyrophosphatase